MLFYFHVPGRMPRRHHLYSFLIPWGIEAQESIKMLGINRSPIVPALAARDLVWLIECYIVDCRTRLSHQLTVDGYAYQLQWFTHWWQEVGDSQDFILTAQTCARFERYLRTAISPATRHRLSYHTRATILKRLREMFNWSLAQGYVERDYADWIPAADGAPPKRHAATLSALHDLLAAVGKGREPLRDRAILAILLGMGLRREEASKLDIADVVVEADSSGYAHIQGKRTKANRDGSRDAAFDQATGKILVEYLDSLPRSSGPLFCGVRKSRLTGQGIYKVVKRAIDSAGLSDQIIGPHDLRRAFATYYRRNRPDKTSADLLRRQLGHASLTQTDEYTLLEVDDIRLDLVSPVALILGGM
jgi:integrase